MSTTTYRVDVQITKTLEVEIDDDSNLNLDVAIFEEAEMNCDGLNIHNDDFEILDYRVLKP